MAIKNKGYSLIEFCLAMCVILPFIWNIIGIIDYYRLANKLEEKIENAFGNRKDFVLKIDERLNVDSNSISDLENLIREKVNKLKNNDTCGANYEGKLIQKRSLEMKNTQLKLPQETYYVMIKGDVDFKKCSKVGGDFLNIMPQDIVSKKYEMVTYEYKE